MPRDKNSTPLLRIFGDRRGVSETIAALLMLFIATAAGTILYTYSSKTFGIAFEGFKDRTSTYEEIAKERFEIISVWSDESSEKVNVTVMNCGKIDVVLDAAYVNGKPVTQFLAGKGVRVSSAQLVNLEFTSPVDIVRNSTYLLVIVSKRGTTVASPWKA
jgi:archaellum component FlaF (FlaF/FlaG flagellin family)